MEIVTLAPRVYECTECGNQITTKTNHRGENIEFDPIAWCCEVDDLREHTTVIELDNGGIIVGEF